MDIGVKLPPLLAVIFCSAVTFFRIIAYFFSNVKTYQAALITNLEISAISWNKPVTSFNNIRRLVIS